MPLYLKFPATYWDVVGLGRKRTLGVHAVEFFADFRRGYLDGQ
jgi:hypothetical protein